MAFIDNIKGLIDYSFVNISNEIEITLDVYRNCIQNNVRNIVCEMMSYFYSNIPFSEDVIKYFTKEKRRNTINNNKYNQNIKQHSLNRTNNTIYNIWLKSTFLSENILHNNVNHKLINNVNHTYDKSIYILKKSIKSYLLEE